MDLHGRRVGGWVIESGVTPPEGAELRSVAKVRGAGPEPSVVELTGWGAWRWAGRRDVLLHTASASGAVTTLPSPRLRPPAAPSPPRVDLAGVVGHAERPLIVRLPPASDVTALVAEVAQRGPVLVVLPSISRARVLSGRLARAGAGVSLLPDGWAQARAGAAVVVGARAAAWGPCPGLSGVVVVDAHDEGLAQEQAPTWHSAVVATERARRAGVPCLLVSPCPTLDLLAVGELQRVAPDEERAGWGALEVVDRRAEDPRSGLYSERLVSLVRDRERVVCVLNRVGRARLLSCAACEELARCERCGAALIQTDRGGLVCGRCTLERPVVCGRCGSTRLRLLRVGVSRAREELESLARRPVGVVDASTAAVPPCDVLVGTESVLRRLSPADGYRAVAFLDFDQELLAPRLRAGEEALGLLALASRLVGGRKGRLLVQTRVPDHPAIRAALIGDPGILSDSENAIRRDLQLPPFAAVALVSGPGARPYVGGLAASGVAVAGPDRDRWLVRAGDSAALADALASVPRPPERLRVEVDPVRF